MWEQIFYSALTMVVMAAIPQVMSQLKDFVQGLLQWCKRDIDFPYKLELSCSNKEGLCVTDNFYSNRDCMTAVKFYVNQKSLNQGTEFLLFDEKKITPLSRIFLEEGTISIRLKKPEIKETGKNGAHRVDKSMCVSSNVSPQHLQDFLVKCKRAQKYHIRHSKPLFVLKDAPSESKSSDWSVFPLDVITTWQDLHYPQKAQLQQDVEGLGRMQKMTLLLHGPPGTGKTSTIRAIAAATKRNIVNVDLTLIKNNQELMSIFYSRIYWGRQGLRNTIRLHNSVFVFEEIDTQLHCIKGQNKQRQSNRKDKDKDNKDKDKEQDNDKKEQDNSGGAMGMMKKFVKKHMQERDCVTMGGLLTALDGILQLHGAIVIMTTNHVDRLDPRMLRSGRITHNILLTRMEPQYVLDMIGQHYPEACSATFQPLCQQYKWLPSDLEQVIAHSRDVHDLEQLMKSKISSSTAK